MDRKQTVITGMGLLTPLGQGVEENWRRLKALESGITRYPCDNHLNDECRYLGKISHFNLPGNVSRKLMNQMKFLNRSGILGFVAANEAVKPQASHISRISPEKRALYIGTGDHTNAGCEFMFPALKEGAADGFGSLDAKRFNKACLDRINPFFLLASLHNNPFSFLSSVFRFKGPNACLASMSPCGLNALELADRSIQKGEADVALVIGCGNWITEIPSYEMNRLDLLSPCREGKGSFKPFDKQRDGYIPGEGAAALLLESVETAEKYNTEILAGIRGVGNCVEFTHCRNFEVPPQISKRAMEMALREGDTNPDALSFVLPHGNATVEGDRSELESLVAVLDGDIANIPICGMKPYTGHLGAASDIVEIIFGIKALKEGFAPGTLNFSRSERAFTPLEISNTHQPCTKNSFLSVSYGSGGQCVSVLLEV